MKNLKNLLGNYGAMLSFLVLLIFVLTAIFATYLAPYDPLAVHSEFAHKPPFWSSGGSLQFILGTDDIGRDLFSRLIYGARYSLGMGLLVVLIAASLGSILGLSAGFFGGWIEYSIMRIVDVLMAIPSILLAIVVVSLLGPNVINSALAVTLVGLPRFVRVVRATVLVEKQKLYVMASKSLGSGSGRLLFRYILPNSLSAIFVQSSFGFSDALLNLAALGFLGMGVPAPTPEWGAMLADARNYIEIAPWYVSLPGLCIFLVVLSVNFIGDFLVDMRIRKTSSD